MGVDKIEGPRGESVPPVKGISPIKRPPEKATVFNLPFQEDGLRLLSQHLHAHTQKAPLSLAQTTVFLTTRRACRRLQSLLLQEAPTSSTVLPRLIPFCDAGQHLQGTQKSFSPEEALGKVLESLTRRQALTLSEALPLAKSFLELEQEGALSELSWTTCLENLFAEDLAAHRQSSLDRLQRVVEDLQGDLPFFPGALQAKVLKDHIRRWRAEAAAVAAPTVDVNAATAAATAHSLDPSNGGPELSSVYGYGLHPKNPLERDFLEALAKKPGGAVWLSGLDRISGEETFQALKPPHPQSGHALFLQQMSLSRDQVPDWQPIGGKAVQKQEDARPGMALKVKVSPDPYEGRAALCHTLFQEAFSVPKSTAPRRRGISLIPCQDGQEETRVISLALRHLVTFPEQKALFVTPDPGLARAVMEDLKRYDLTPDTGSGVPLGRTEPGVFLSLVLEATFTPDPLTRLALFKHPLYRLGLAPERVRDDARHYEKSVLRSDLPRPPEGDLAAFLSAFTEKVAGFKKRLYEESGPPAAFLEHHLQVAEQLSQNEKGYALIWSKELGNLAFDASAELLRRLKSFPAIEGSAYPGLFRNLMASKSLHLSQSVHPRLLVLDPDQATLQKADLLILGGMTDKNWPAPASRDPWLSEGIRRELGLPTAQDQWALDSHLFTEFIGGFPRVMCTYAARTATGPQRASPFLKRLEVAALCEGVDLTPEDPWQAWAKALVSVDQATPRPRPAPCPPATARPTCFSVTGVETLGRNPYLFYVQKILGLQPLPHLQTDPGPALYGTLLHEILEAFLAEEPLKGAGVGAESESESESQTAALARLLALGRQKMTPFRSYLAARYFWNAHFEEVARWFIGEQAALERPAIRLLEETGVLEWRCTLPGGEAKTVLLTAKADRLDQNPAGAVRILDYKSGRLPLQKEVLTGATLQLALEGVILEEGGFKGLAAPLSVESLEYWHLHPPCKRVIYREDRALLMAQAKKRLTTILEACLDPQMPFRAALDRGREGPFEPLLRTQEWLMNSA